MANNSIDNSPVIRVVFVSPDNNSNISNAPVMPIVMTDAAGQPVY